MKIPCDKRIRIDLKKINDAPGPYSMSFHFDLSMLIRSIEGFGLINRPFITETKEGRVDIVAGFRRIIALKSLRKDSVECIDLTESDLPPLDLLMLNLYDNLSTRDFNDVEKGMVLSRLINHITEAEIIEKYMPLLQLPSHEETLNLYLNLEKLDRQMKISLAEKAISLKTIKRLLEIDHESRIDLFKLLLKLKLNFNNQMQLIDYINDISIRDGLSIPGLIRDKILNEILEGEQLNNPQKVKKIMAHLRAMRYPTFVRFEDAFHQRVSSLVLPKGVKIYHPPYFEAPGFRLEISFKGGKELKEKVDSLSRIRDLEGICNDLPDREN